ncbi:MAG: Lrp/AsnC family transcriptional regulator [Actinomycetota bacterium]|nr:Lrp/AsnC family transcriptional regulator [Actinomycetota bacterium]
MVGRRELDSLDVAILSALRSAPRSGYLELSRTLEVSRATIQARLERLERDGIVTGYGPDIELAAAGYPVLAFATLEIAQGRLAEVTEAMAAIPSVVEAYATTGPGDVHCRLAASSHEDLQRVLIEVSQIPGVARSTSVVALSRVVEYRAVDLLASGDVPPASRTGSR